MTLFNKNFSKQILSQFDSQPKDFDFIDTSSARMAQASPEGAQEPLLRGKYDSLKFEIVQLVFHRITHFKKDEAEETEAATIIEEVEEVEEKIIYCEINGVDFLHLTKDS